MARTAGSDAATTGPRIRAAAQRLFARHGYAAVSMRQIAAEVGVQAGALYNYTPDKQSLLFEMMRAHLEELLASWEAEDEGADPRAALRAFCHFHIRFHLARPEAVFIAYMELRNLEPGNFEVIEGLRKRYETALEDILRAGKAEGVFTLVDTKLAALAVIAMLTGVTTWYREEGRLSRERVAEIYWDMVRRAVGA
ncbi:AcrR family transcriptional regulator [Rhodovulum iodosum]|uniref:AcrR family transcriptional regulator n=1 Tax=Rhodovulum iodosum TaxID=68291 RepID=A0ABV3XW81_9RHOB|nr:TetR/AcrR family transcriptional regulator [Rhodovulum robiginosum]RSK36739.1 TetR/AcrR family transcriptional regulator [Rhodovulum robiginosum]